MNRIRTLIGLFISAVFLYLAFRNSDFGQIWGVLRQAEWIWVLAAFPFLALSFWLRAVRWRYLLLPAGQPGLHSLFSAIMIGFMSLNVLPLRLGEFIRAYVLGRREGMPVSGVFATVVLERLFDGFTVLLFLVTSLFLLPLPLGPKAMAWVRAFSYMALTIYILAIVFIVLIKVKTELMLALTDRALRRFPKFQDVAQRMILSFAAGLDSLKSVRLFIIITAYSVLVWLSAAGFYWVIMFAFQAGGGFNLGSHVGAIGSLFVLAGLALGIMIPASPGAVGTFEVACIASLAALGVPKPMAEGYAILAHAANYIPITLAGIIYLYTHNLSLKEIRTGAQETRTRVEE